MEQQSILSPGQAGREPVAAELGRGAVVTRFDERRELPATPPVISDFRPERGDHNLNTDMAPRQPLIPAAVLVPIVDRTQGLQVLFTQRTAHLANHAGQISFPGGHVEPEDGGPLETALRETEEEIGLDRRHVEVVGHLDTYVTRTGFSVTPIVAFVNPPFSLQPDAHEVAEVFEVPLSFLLDPANHLRCARTFDGVERYYYAIPYRAWYIWGATAGMLINLYQVLTHR